jgi:hypothetical protein
MALTGLWAVPWLMEVEGYTRDQAAFHLLLTSLAMLIGFLSIAAFVVRLKHMGIDPETILKVGLGVGIATLLAVRLGFGSSHLQWFMLGLVFSVSNLAYALLAGHFPRELSGRVNTALNLGTFIGAFGIQWGIGALVDLFIAQGMSTPDAYRWAFGALIALQAATYGWFLLGGRQAACRDG